MPSGARRVLRGSLVRSLPWLAGCGSASEPSPPAGRRRAGDPDPVARSRRLRRRRSTTRGCRWSRAATWVYAASPAPAAATSPSTVTDETPRGRRASPTTVVHDVVDRSRRRGHEDTDWFAQDADGQRLVLRPARGEWEAGGRRRRGRAGDGGRPRGSATATGRSSSRVSPRTAQRCWPRRTVAASRRATFDDLLVTEDTTPLEPELVERKFYAVGVGLVREETVAGGPDAAWSSSRSPTALSCASRTVTPAGGRTWVALGIAARAAGPAAAAAAAAGRGSTAGPAGPTASRLVIGCHCCGCWLAPTGPAARAGPLRRSARPPAAWRHGAACGRPPAGSTAAGTGRARRSPGPPRRRPAEAQAGAGHRRRRPGRRARVGEGRRSRRRGAAPG